MGSGAPATGTRGRILHLIKRRGPLTARTIAESLGITPMAVRQHLQHLQATGLVAYRDRRGKVGRPSRHWHLAPRARGHFPDRHADMAATLLQAARQAFGEPGVRRLLERWREIQVAGCREQLPGPGASPRERVAALAALREEQGYMAEVREDGQELVLLQNHCPIFAAASSCGELCELELQTFSELLGEDLQVQRTEHLSNGERRCSYRILPAPQQV